LSLVGNRHVWSVFSKNSWGLFIWKCRAPFGGCTEPLCKVHNAPRGQCGGDASEWLWVFKASCCQSNSRVTHSRQRTLTQRSLACRYTACACVFAVSTGATRFRRKFSPAMLPKCRGEQREPAWIQRNAGNSQPVPGPIKVPVGSAKRKRTPTFAQPGATHEPATSA
jgi:hypothetical protein